MSRTHVRWWPVERIYFIGPAGLDLDALSFTVSHRAVSAPPLSPVATADEIPETTPDGVLVLVLSSPRHTDPAAHALRATERGFRTVVLGVPLPARTRARLLTHDVVHLTRDQVSALVTAINTGVLKAASPDEVARLAATPPASPVPPDLTRRELELMRAVQRMPYAPRKQLATELGVSDATAKVHLAHLGHKLGVSGGGRRALHRAVLTYRLPDEL